MRVHASFYLLLAVLFCSCASDHFTAGRGDVGQFILQQAIVRGGNPITTNNLPAIAGEWRYSIDKYGVVIRASREQYPKIEALLHQAFGEPKYGPADTTNGGKIGGYRLSPKGGGIQFLLDTNCTQVIIIRPLSQQEWLGGVQRATKAMSESQ